MTTPVLTFSKIRRALFVVTPRLMQSFLQQASRMDIGEVEERLLGFDANGVGAGALNEPGAAWKSSAMCAAAMCQVKAKVRGYLATGKSEREMGRPGYRSKTTENSSKI